MADHGPDFLDDDRPACETCRRRKVKGCDSGQPHCNNCIGRGLKCDYSPRSFPAGVLSSAAGLLHDTFSSDGDQIGAALSQALHEGSKAGSSSGVAGSATSLAYQPTPKSRFALAMAVVSENESFRSSIRANVPQEAFEGMTMDQFLKNDHEFHDNLFDVDHKVEKGKGAVYSKPVDGITRSSYNTPFNSIWQSRSVEKVSRSPETDSLHDGDEVVKLLSDPTFQPDVWTGDNSEESYSITEEEVHISRWFIQNTQARAPQREKLLYAVTAARSGQAYEEFASVFDEIENYQEDVWGYIRPLVEAARGEQIFTEPTTMRDSPAVHRLRMIVAHLQPFAVSDPAKTSS